MEEEGEENETLLSVAKNLDHKDHDLAERIIEDSVNYYKIFAGILQRCMEERQQVFTPEQEFSPRKALIERAIQQLVARLELDDPPQHA